MLFLDPVSSYREELPSEIHSAITFLREYGFDGPVARDLLKINLGLRTPLVEKSGKITYGDFVVGYVRACYEKCDKGGG